MTMTLSKLDIGRSRRLLAAPALVAGIMLGAAFPGAMETAELVAEIDSLILG